MKKFALAATVVLVAGWAAVCIAAIFMSGCSSDSETVHERDSSSVSGVTTADDGTCSSGKTDVCRGNIYINGELKTPSTLGFGTQGKCYGSVCCLGCWDGSKCLYLDSDNCSDPSSTENGLSCRGPCLTGQSCQLTGNSSIPIFFSMCKR